MNSSKKKRNKNTRKRRNPARDARQRSQHLFDQDGALKSGVIDHGLTHETNPKPQTKVVVDSSDSEDSETW